MSLELSKEDYRLICKLVEEVSGISFDDSKEYLLKTRLVEFASKYNFTNYRDLYLSISSKPTLREEAVSLLTTGETFWFRDTPIWDGLQKQILLPLLFEIARGKRDSLKIWSCACSTGQEPYSLGIALQELMEQNNLTSMVHGKIEIIASDLSQHALEFCKKGFYTKAALERGPTEKILPYFEFDSHAQRYRISSKIQSMVKFEKINLINSFHHLIPRMDLILCRNVAIYFTDQTKKLLFSRLAQVLKENGTIVLGSSEAILDPSCLLVKDKRYSIVCYCPSGT